MLEAAGFRAIHRDDVCSRRGYLAGDDPRRADELMEMVEKPEVDVVLCARGGYGSQRIVPRLDPGRVRRAAKPFVGYSDATTLHLWMRRVVGLVSFHGPMLERGGDLQPEELEGLLAMLSGRSEGGRSWQGDPGRDGVGEGRLVGGNLSLVAGSLGTPWEIETRGAILLVEEVHEEPYRVDRLLGQLAAAGKLAGLAGVGVGALVDCVPTARPIDPELHGAANGPSARSALAEWLDPLGIPQVFGLPFGHQSPNQAWPLGVRARLDGKRGELHILESGVRRP